MRRLRAPQGGCPWDREQTFASIVPHTLEEAYEVADVIERERLDELPGELGDLLFQIVFYAQLGAEAGLFDFDDVVREIEGKLRHRHPHVFGGAEVADAAGVSRQWEALKATERAATASAAPSELDAVPAALPALSRARKLQQRAARVGFDWPEVGAVVAKLDEEIAEFKAALAAGSAADIDDELGDVLFAAVNLSRHLGRDAEALLRAASRKFERRFRDLERRLAARAASFATTDPAVLDALWEAAKADQG
jgi:MazG family protein